MKLRKWRRNRRGVEAAISAILMLVITVFAFTIVVASTLGYVNWQRTGPLMKLQERLSIEEVWFNSNSSGKYVSVYIRNTGINEIKLLSVQVLLGGGVVASYYPVLPSGESAPITVPIGLGTWMNVTYSWSAMQTYGIKVMTEKGNEMTIDASA